MEVLKTLGDVVAGDLDRAELIGAISDVNVLWVRLRHRIDRELLDAACKLRVIASPTTGLDHIDLASAAERGITVVSLRGATEFLRDVRATAELTIGLMLSLLRQIGAASRDVVAGNWNRDRFKGRELRGATVGLVGYGRLGRLVAGYLRAFGANVIATDPYVSTADVPLVALSALLAQSDIVSLHVALTEQTHGLIDARAFSGLKPGALLINTSRGAIVDETALLSALDSGRLAGAALDVIAGEHSDGLRDSPLVAYAAGHENLLITPHIGGCTFESMEATEVYLAEQLREAVRTGT
jgi:D-3-phosphoglycerate dehydrogenase